MHKFNKAHTATINRIARRYGGAVRLENHRDLQTPYGLVGVETAATVGRRIQLLTKKHNGPAYVAVTNKEALFDALRAAKGSRIGVMDPQGNIVKRAEFDENLARSDHSTAESTGEHAKADGEFTRIDDRPGQSNGVNRRSLARS